MPYQTLQDGERLYYETCGSGPPLMLVTGLSGLASFWAPHLERLSEHFTVVTHDHRGTGRSSVACKAFSVEQMAADVLALMDGLGIRRAHLVGHSTGGAIGQVIGIERPDRLDRMVLSATWAGPDPYFKLLFEQRRAILETFGARAYLRWSLLVAKPPSWIAAHPEEIADLDDDEVAARLPDVRCQLDRIDAIVAFDRRSEVHRITVPTLVAGVADDIVTPAYMSEELAGLIPGARLSILPDGGHFYPLTRPEAFLAQVGEFLLGRLP